MRNSAGGGDNACGQFHVVAVTHHDRERYQSHGDHRSRDSAGDRAQNGADNNHRVGEPAAHRSEQLAHALQQIFGHAAALQDCAHKSKEGNCEQQFVRQNAEHALGQRLQQRERKKTEFNADKAEEQTHRCERECHRVADQHERDQPS